MEIYIIRHGETAGNREHLLNGWTDIPLAPDGVTLAAQTGRALRGITFDAAYTSPLIRAEQTAQLVLSQSGNDNTPLIHDDRIKEIFAGNWEGISMMNISDPVLGGKIRDYLAHPKAEWGFPGGETLHQVMVRTQAFLKEAAQGPQQRILVSTHGCALRCMLNFLYEDPSDFWQGRMPYNCAVSIVSAENGNMKLLAKDKIYYDPALCVDRYSFTEKA